MSIKYDEYLTRHKYNVARGLLWFRQNLPEVLKGKEDKNYNYEWQIGMDHDSSKTSSAEYYAYDEYFYGGNKSFTVVQEFNKAWLHHIHNNPHHWQYWVLITDDPNEGETILDMPDNYIVEMICDWWSFSWSSGNLYEIFKWYEDRKDYIKLSIRTRKKVEGILRQMCRKLLLQSNEGEIND